MLKPNDTIGRYRVLRPLGQGGMGAVYLAHDPGIDRQVAIKLMREGFDDDALRERFVREARSAGRLRHPNIVTIFDIGEHEGAPYIAMEFVQGVTLTELIRGGAEPLAVRLRLLEQLCDGLDHAHRAGMVHRDIKPSNLMVDSTGDLKILDFGIAHVAGSSTTNPGMIVGSLSHMSPEQIAGRQVDARSDIFSVGTVAYELVGGQKAFSGSIQDGILQRILSEPAPQLAERCPGLDSALPPIVARALEKNPADRYQTLADMRRDLQLVRLRLPDGDCAAGDSGERGSAGRDGRHASAAGGDQTVMIAAPPPAPVPAGPASEGTVILSRSAAVEDAVSVRLIVIQSPDPRLANRSLTLTAERYEIGRASTCDLVSTDPQWSRRHAEIVSSLGRFAIRDLGSRNGTFVNGRPLGAEEVPLFFGAQIAIGGTVLTFAPVSDTSLPDLTGLEIGGRYVLLRLMRESAKGAVYEARQKNLSKHVALKLLSPELLRYPGYRERFRREAELASRLNHPHVCDILDHGEAVLAVAGRQPILTEYLCLRLMAGGSLADRLDRDAAIPYETIAGWLEDLTSALDHAHGLDVVHGDLKPTAVVFDRPVDGNPYLTDFAIGGPGDAASASTVIGTPAYMAPEQWEGAPATPATDQFGLALLSYQMVTGLRPFEGQEHPEIRRRNFKFGPLPAHDEVRRTGRPPVHPQVSEVLTRALAQAPADRHPSISEFTGSLVDALRGNVPVPDPNAPPRVFISYQRGHAGGWPNLIAKQLQAVHGIEAFLDVERIDGAKKFPERLTRMIKAADVFVCLLGPTTHESEWVQREIQLAREQRKPMIPVFHEDYEIPDISPAGDTPIETLLAYDGVRLLDRQNLYVDSAIADLARRVKDTVGRRPG